MMSSAGTGAMWWPWKRPQSPNRYRDRRSRAPRQTGGGRLGGAHAEVGLCSISRERLRVGRIDWCGCQWHQPHGHGTPDEPSVLAHHVTVEPVVLFPLYGRVRACGGGWCTADAPERKKPGRCKFIPVFPTWILLFFVFLCFAEKKHRQNINGRGPFLYATFADVDDGRRWV